MIKFYLNITTSKFLAYLIFIVGSIYGFYFNDSNVLIATFAASSAVTAVKSYTASRERIIDKEKEQVNCDEENNI